MTTILTEVYDAFVSAGVPDDKARKAAEALSGHERRFDKLENTIDLRFSALERNVEARFAALKGDMDARFVALKGEMDARFVALKGEMDARFANVDTRFAKVDGELLLLKWMMGFTLALVFAIFAKQFVH